jgi:hypothetical protein
LRRCSHGPDWSALPSDVPSGIRKLLRRCLQKDLRKRLRDTGDARIEIEEALACAPEGEAPADGEKPRTGGVGAGILIRAVLIGTVSLLIQRGSAPVAVTKFSIPLPSQHVISPSGVSVRLSRDGTKLAWVAAEVTGRSQIYTRPIDEFDAKLVENTTGASSASFSPDGAWLAYTHAGSRTIKKIALSGGAPMTVANYETASMSTGPRRMKFSRLCSIPARW